VLILSELFIIEVEGRIDDDVKQTILKMMWHTCAVKFRGDLGNIKLKWVTYLST